MQKNKTNLVSKEDRAKRIREERKRLGYTQQQIADICGVHRVQWGRYERGEQGLDGEPLNKFGNVGARVSYILTGQSSNVTSIGQIGVKKNKMSDDEKEMNELFSELAPEEKKAVLNMARLLVKQKGHCED